jgi:tetratricopeptide (TPR) repeat protein
MATADSTLALAMRHFQEGRFAAAERLCREVLQSQARHPEGLYLLGLLASQAGRHEAARTCFEQVLALIPSHALAHFHRGLACQALGQSTEAIAAYREAARWRPDLAEAHRRLGLALREQGRLDEAESSIRQALAHDASSPELHNELGILLAQRGEMEQAVGSFRNALERRPGYSAALANLGLALARQGRLPEAITCYQRALCLQPDSAEAHVNLGNAYREQGKLEAAAAAYQRALEIQPTLTEAHLALGQTLARQGRLAEAAQRYRQGLHVRPEGTALRTALGNVLQKQDRLEEAADVLQRALAGDPSSAEAHNAFGIVEARRARPEQALACFERALQLQPELADAHTNRALVLLLMGDYARGWAEYEWRWRSGYAAPRSFPQPLWDGSPLEGRTILVHTEMGIGDTLMFVRYARVLQQRGGRVVLECPPNLVRLLSRCAGVEQVVARGQALPAFDIHAPLMSLPYLCRTTLATIPAEVPYVTAEPDLVAQWGLELQAEPGLRIGIVWQGGLASPTSRIRAVPLAAFAPLAWVPGVRLFSLQKGYGSEQLQEVAGRFPIIDLGHRLDEDTRAFVDTAAVLSNLDLVISSDTSMVHLAGALGRPVWVAMVHPSEWHWLRDRTDSPWYPTLRLFRQEKSGEWGPVFRRMAAELRQKVSEAGWSPLHVPVPTAPGELVDRVVSLQLRKDHGTGRAAEMELAALSAEYAEVQARGGVAGLAAELRAVHESLGDIEEGMRDCERKQDFGSRFIDLARSLRRCSEEREALKQKITAMCQECRRTEP